METTVEARTELSLTAEERRDLERGAFALEKLADTLAFQAPLEAGDSLWRASTLIKRLIEESVPL